MERDVRPPREAATGPGRPQMVSDEEIADALIAARGNVGAAVNYFRRQGIRVGRGALYNRISKSEFLQETKDDCDETLIDFAESKLIGLIDKGSFQAISFYLRTKGRKRGYADKQDVELSGGVSVAGVLDELEGRGRW